MDLFATVCAQVSAKAATETAWANLAAVLQDPETAAFFKARLPADGEGDPPSKRRKQDSEAETKAPTTVCQHCGSNVPEIELRVACMNGTTLEVTAPEGGFVRDLKSKVGQVRVNDGDLCVVSCAKCLLALCAAA
jgi:hypothetical protein